MAQAYSLRALFSSSLRSRSRRGHAAKRQRHGDEVAAHSFQREGAIWRCRNCEIQARTKSEWTTMRHRACIGPCAMRAASSHALYRISEHRVTACFRCGAWATRMPRRLLYPCQQRPTTAATSQALIRLRKGLHPTAKLRSRRTDNTKALPLRKMQ